MKLTRINVYGITFNNGCGIDVKEHKTENGKYVRWTPELQKAWDKYCDNLEVKYGTNTF